jgi:hypothetical protein
VNVRMECLKTQLLKSVKLARAFAKLVHLILLMVVTVAISNKIESLFLILIMMGVESALANQDTGMIALLGSVPNAMKCVSHALVPDLSAALK